LAAPCTRNIDIICANSSLAKGRVERANKTLQDRPVKELRLASEVDLLRLTLDKPSISGY